MDRPARPVVHVTESFGGGVATAIKDYCRNYPRAEHHLIYSPRKDSPITQRDLRGFTSVRELPPSHWARIRTLRQIIGGYGDAVIHAHSSFAGAYVRVAVRKSQRRPIVYTPHCYGFERQDIDPIRQSIYRLAEWLLAFNTTVFAGCSSREIRLSNWPLAPARRVLVPNVPASDLEQNYSGAELGLKAGRRPHDGKMTIVGAGRLSPQKDPRFFRQSVQVLRDAGLPVEAFWIGGGDLGMESMLRKSGINVTGWLPRTQALACMREADLYLHTARWEGFPLAVLESSVLGVATLVRDISAFEAVDPELKMAAGIPAFTSSSLRDKDSFEVWRQKNLGMWKAQLSNNHDRSQAQSLKQAYSPQTG